MPLKPPINATGINTANITRTIAITGPWISLIDFIAASFTEIPFSARIILSVFSITIIASSTTRPIARINPKRVKRLIENPKRYIPANVPIRETGIARAGIIVALNFPKNINRIIVTYTIASINVLITSWIEA